MRRSVRCAALGLGLVLSAGFAGGQIKAPAGTFDPAALKKSCDKGSATDCYTLARRYLQGEGLPKDAPKAEKH